MPSTDPPSLRQAFLEKHPKFPWLDSNHPGEIEQYLRERRFIGAAQKVLGCAPAGSGNMNLTLRVRLEGESFILKQSRPWVEKYEAIAAPWDRDAIERRFYRHASSVPALAALVPSLLNSDPGSHVLVLEDLAGAQDMTSLYAGADVIRVAEIDALANFLVLLHESAAPPFDETVANRAMRRLNYEHIFNLPLQRGYDLDAFEPGLEAATEAFREDRAALCALEETGERYLADGPVWVHGDYFPGSWLRTGAGIRIIDFEFSFPGDAEFDLGVAMAHLALARQDPAASRRLLERYTQARPGGDIDPAWLARYAGAEVVRRLIGVAQLPIPVAAPGRDGWKRDLLDGARGALVDGSPVFLFGAPE